MRFVVIGTLGLIGGSALPVIAQPLDQTWTLTVAGQTVQANADGSFRIPNVSAPDLFGANGPGSTPDFLSDDFVRLTGFSTKNGRTRYVFTDPFQIRQGQAFRLTDADLTFTDTPPALPEALRAVPDAPTLTRLGQTTRLRVTAGFPGGSTRDVSRRVDWTVYRTSNPNIATVNRDGVVTAVREGTAFLTAVNEGATAVARVDVSPGDPLTTVTGFVRNSDGSAATGVTITLVGAGGTSTSGAEGFFSIPGVATTTEIRAVVAREGEGESLKMGVATPVTVVPGGSTGVGNVTLKGLCEVIQPCVDSDKDGLPNHLETFLVLDPQKPDTDGNGISDGDEDFDGDGLPNLVELFAGTPMTWTVVSGGFVEGGITNRPVRGVNRIELEALPGDTLALNVGKVSGTSDFYPRIRLFGADGALLLSDYGDREGRVTLPVTNAGPYMVLVDSFYPDGVGVYRLHFAKVPGAFITPRGDEGGTLTNGLAHNGVLTIGDMDFWSFTANAGDAVQLRGVDRTANGTSYPWLRLHGPGGAFIGSDIADTDEARLNFTAPTNGTYNLLVASYFKGYSGLYDVRYTKVPGAFIIPPGDEGGPLTNGGNHGGTNTLGDEDIWTFTANAGDNVVLRAGRVSGSGSYYPWLRLHGPDGSVVKDEWNNDADTFLSYRATNGGPYTLLVGSYYTGHQGVYNLRYLKVPGEFIIPPGDEGGPLTNGGNHGGTNTLGDEDIWTFTANAGDNVVLRAGRVSGSGSYYPWLRLHGPDGSVVKDEWNNDADTLLTYRATNGGPYTLLVGSYYTGHQGVYNLRYLKVPGEFVIPPGDEGGPLTNGGNHGGTNTLGDEDIWTFTANAGDNVVLRAGRVSGSGSYYPWLRLHGSDGSVVKDEWNNDADTFLSYRATNGGPFTLLVGSYYTGHQGVYNLRYLKVPGEFIIPPGDEGGPLTNGVTHGGTNSLGDEDIWRFTANAGDNVVLRAERVSGSGSYYPWLRLHGPDGTVVNTAWNSSGDAVLEYPATVGGTYTLLVGSYYTGHSGVYRVSLTGGP